MQRFPQGLFKPGNKPAAGLLLDFLTVNNDEELAAALQAGWFESPEDADASRSKHEKEVQGDRPEEVLTRAQLEAQAEAKGIKVDKRWGDARLKAELAKA